MRRGGWWHKTLYGELFHRRNFPTTDLFVGAVQLVKLPTLSRFHCGSLLGEGVVRPAAANIRKWKCLENGERSGGLSYCVGEKVSSVRRWEDVGSGILHPIDNLLKR